MRRSAVIVFLLILAAGIATLWLFLEGVILEKTHPLPYYEAVEAACRDYAVPKEVVYGVMSVESGFKSDAVSDKGAIGLMQITPDTFYWLCSKTGDTETNPERLYNPEVNIRYGACFLSALYTEFGVWDTVYAAYNAGRGRVNAWLDDPAHGKNGRLTDIPFKETARYVEKVAAAADNYKTLYFAEDARAKGSIPEKTPQEPVNEESGETAAEAGETVSE